MCDSEGRIDRKEQVMGRKAKHPDHPEQVKKKMDELLDEVVEVWTSEKEPELKAIAEEIEFSPAKLRKLLITASVRDHKSYYSYPVSDMVLKLYREGRSVAEIMAETGLSYSSVGGYLPHKTVYNLDTMSAECERIKIYRRRRKAVDELKTHLGLPNESLWLWRCVIAFEGYPFKTSGRGSREGVKFKYTVSREGGKGGRRYEGESVEGFGNELRITTGGEEKKKSISRSTVDLALKNANGAKGPKALGLPGSGSYLHPMLIRFGIIEIE